MTATNLVWHRHVVDKSARGSRNGQRPCLLWFTGLSGSGKSTLAGATERALFEHGQHTYLMDGDNIRQGLNSDLGFSPADRTENIRRIGEVAKLFVDAGLIMLTAFISPYRDQRQWVRNLLAPGEFIEVFVDSPLAVCEQRDPKGLYEKARRGEITGFTGVDAPYEVPSSPEIIIRSSEHSVERCVNYIMAFLTDNGIVVPCPD